MAPSSPPQRSSPSQPFKSYPQKYPRATQASSRFAASLQHLVRQAPHSQVAVVVDPSFHVSQGYVLCQTNAALVRVYAVPYGSVINGMRLYVRQIGSLRTNQGYIFDGFAPNLSGLGLNGSVLVTTTPSGSTLICSSGSLGATFTVPVLTSSIGYYWHCFFYLPLLPTTTVTLLHFLQYVGGTNAVSLEYLPSGYLQFRSQDNHGYITNNTVPPHNAHWVVVQPGNTGAELLVDGVANYSGLQGTGDIPTFTGGSATTYAYALSYLTTNTGTQGAPIGSWVSKMGYGMNYQSGVVPFSSSIPAYDSQVPNLNVGTTQKTQNLYLCEDGQGSPTLTNVGQLGNGGNLTVTSPYATVQVPGPY